MPPGCALHRAQDPEGWQWTPDTYLLANLVDLAAAGNWQRGGGKGRRPKPLPRPGARPDATRWGNAKGLDPRTVRARLDAKKPKRG